MNEYMLLIRNQPSGKNELTGTKHEEFLKACERYINDLQSKKRLISAQPMAREGSYVSMKDGMFVTTEFTYTSEMIVGYYHVRAENLVEAISIAQGNPEFKWVRDARIEVRPLKTKERSTNYEYPSGNS